MCTHADSEFLQELKYFRWILYHHEKRKSKINENDKFAKKVIAFNKNLIANLTKYHWKHNDVGIIIEEHLIANYSLINVISHCFKE